MYNTQLNKKRQTAEIKRMDEMYNTQLNKKGQTAEINEKG